MKKLLSVLLIVLVFTLSSCVDGKLPEDLDDIVIPDDIIIPDDLFIPKEADRILIGDNITCPNGVLLNNVCVQLGDLLTDNISVRGTETIVNYGNNGGAELMNDYVADLTGSAGLAVMPREVFEDNIDLSGSEAIEFLNLAATEDLDEDTENLIVTLTEDGFFEEVSFTDRNGNDVEIMANPLALEVYGAFTVVIFEVNAQNYGPDYEPNFDQRVYDSLYSGGIYLIHNESGKLFSTKEIVLQEESYSNDVDFSRDVFLTVTLNEPVFETVSEPVTDENGNYVFDENGNLTFVDTVLPVLDGDGVQLVYTEGPYQTETIEILVTESYQVEILEEVFVPLFDVDGNPVLDAEGNPTYKIELDADGNPVLDAEGNEIFVMDFAPVLDAEGNPTYEIEVVPVLDANGNQVIEYLEQVVVDADGNPVYEQQFEVQLFIEDIRTITYTTYYSTVSDGPLTGLARKFVDKIMQDYYNWSYWRPSLYSLSQNTFAVIASDIYYMERQSSGDNDQIMEDVVIKLSYDGVNEELILEPYLNTTKVNFDECEILIDPSNGNIICNKYDGDIKLYAPAPGPGLVTIDDSDGLQSVTFPNGELYFFNQQYDYEYIEELGYSTSALYTINDLGELETHYIELGAKPQVCGGSEDGKCVDYMYVDVEDSLGVVADDQTGVYLQMNDGDNRISTATLQIQTIGEFSSERAACTEEACWYQVQYEILDLDGNVIASFDNEEYVDANAEVPNFRETYQIDPSAHIQYEREQSTDPKICDEIALGIGCIDEFYLIENTITENDNWIRFEHIIADGDTLMDRMEINETNTVVYEYTKDVAGFECLYTTCEEIVRLKITDLDGTVLRDEDVWMNFAQGEIIPVRVEYNITEDTVTTFTNDVCTTSSGCWQGYWVDDSYFNLQYDQGEAMYQSIEFAETDIVYITEETLTSEICMDVDGCGYTYVDFIISDGETELYSTERHYNLDYGTQIPFRVLIDISETTFTTENEYSQDDKICEEDTCSNWVNFYMIDDTKTYGEDGYHVEHIGQEWYTYVQNEKIISMIGVPTSTVPTVVDTLLCKQLDGCSVSTRNYTVEDVDGVDYTVTLENYSNRRVYIEFAYGEPIPNDEDFMVEFLIKDIEYYEERIQVHEFMWALRNTIILDDNLYLIEKESWAQGDDNFILTFNELTDRYSVKYTNISAVIEITQFEDSYIAINDNEDAILNFSYNEEMSDENYYYFDVEDLTDGLAVFAVSDLIVDFDGTVYFSGVDNYTLDITGRINDLGEVIIDTDYTPVDVIRIRPIN